MTIEHEVPVDKVHEQAAEVQHAQGEPHGRAWWFNPAAVSTALYAVVAAIAALLSGQHANAALYEANQAVFHQAKAVDLWSEFQADSIKKYLAQNQAVLLSHVGGGPEEVQQARAEAERRQQVQDQLRPQAEGEDHQVEQLLHESEQRLAKHERFAGAVALLQIAIGLSAVAVLFGRFALWGLSLVAGLLGLGWFLAGWFVT